MSPARRLVPVKENERKKNEVRAEEQRGENSLGEKKSSLYSEPRPSLSFPSTSDARSDIARRSARTALATDANAFLDQPALLVLACAPKRLSGRGRDYASPSLLQGFCYFARGAMEPISLFFRDKGAFRIAGTRESSRSRSRTRRHRGFPQTRVRDTHVTLQATPQRRRDVAYPRCPPFPKKNLFFIEAGSVVPRFSSSSRGMRPGCSGKNFTEMPSTSVKPSSRGFERGSFLYLPRWTRVHPSYRLSARAP